MMNLESIFYGERHLLIELIAILILAFLLLYFTATSLLRLKKLMAGVLTGILLLLGTTIYATIYLLPAPRIVRTVPEAAETGFPLNRKIVILFDRPVSRVMLSPSLVPEVAGKWVYENGVIPNHMMTRLVFYPAETLPAETEFTIFLKNIENVTRKTTPYDATYKFKTQESPRLSRVTPANNQKEVGPDSKIEVYLTAPNGNLSQINFELSPSVPYEVKEDLTRTHLTVSLKQPLAQGTRYRLTITKADLRRNVSTNEIVKTGPESQIYSGYFTTKEAVGIDSFSPLGNKVTSREPITIRFSKAMVEADLKKNFSISPPVEGNSLLIDGVIFVFTPLKYNFETNYQVKLAKGTRAKDGSFLPDELVHEFTTLGKVGVEKIIPREEAAGVATKQPIEITFDQDVSHESAQKSFSLEPKVIGKFSWKGKTMIFTPSKPLPPDTKFAVRLAAGIVSTDGLDSDQTFSYSFTTQTETTILAVPLYFQQHPLSCEAASLRMALAYRKVDIAENDLLGQIGIDPTPHSGSVWGDPHKAFVGNVNGKQMTTGYGVYWEPIARVARKYRKAQEFSAWSASQVLTEVKKGHPVIIWTYSKSGTPTHWFTPSGEKIFAVAGEHTVVVIGYVGPEDDPTAVIVNDSLEGKVYWSRATFDKKFGTFSGSGVVVY